MQSRHMALTQEHVAQVHRVLEDPGPDPTWTYHMDEAYHALVQGLLASHPSGQDTWLFAYGSLIWKPELEHVETRRAAAQGWHRSFCFRIERFRGTREQVAVLVRLSDDNEVAPGQWYLEAGFGRIDGGSHPTFSNLDLAHDWIGERVAHRSSN
jgi:hypothetical protein